MSLLIENGVLKKRGSDMSLRACVVLIMSTTLVGCAGLPPPPYDTDAHIESYLTGMNLPEHSVADAGTILAREGFHCEAHNEILYCDHFLQGSRSLAITLTPDPTDRNRCVFEYGFSFIIVRAIDSETQARVDS